MTSTTTPATTSATSPTTTSANAPAGRPAPVPVRRRPSRRRPWPLEFYRSTVGKKWVMAVTGIVLLGFVLGHMVGNLKLYLSKEEINLYGEALREIPSHLLPRTWLLWSIRGILALSFVLHVHAAVGLTAVNRRARPEQYKAPRDYVVASYASRTMRYSGVIVGLYLLFHLMDLTWGNANPEFVRGDPYNNLVYSFQRVPVAIVYIVANLALGLHISHGAWSMLQSLGINNPKYNAVRKRAAQAFAALVVVGNVSFPIAVQANLVEPACPHTDPVGECDAPSGLEID